MCASLILFSLSMIIFHPFLPGMSVPWPQLIVFRAHHIIFIVLGKVLIENIVIMQKVWDNGLNIHTMYKAPPLKRKKVSYSETVNTC